MTANGRGASVLRPPTSVAAGVPSREGLRSTERGMLTWPLLVAALAHVPQLALWTLRRFNDRIASCVRLRDPRRDEKTEGT